MNRLVTLNAAVGRTAHHFSEVRNQMGRLDKTKEGDQVAYRRFSPLGAGSVNARFWNPATQTSCQQPPVGEADGHECEHR